MTVNGKPLTSDEETESVCVDFNPDSAWHTHACRTCGGGLTATTTGWVDEHGDTECPLFGPDDDTDDEVTGPHNPAPVPFAWCNSAAITTDDGDDTITVSLSVGDPRGAFCVSLTRIPDDADSDLAGCLILHTPHPHQSSPHAALTELHPGAFIVGAVPAALTRTA